MERLLTTEEVAEVLRVDPVTVRRLIMRGELTAYRIAGEYRFRPSELSKFVESQRVVINVSTENQLGDKFTDRTRKILGMATEEAFRAQHGEAGPDHLLLAIMAEGNGIAARALIQMRVRPDDVRARLAALHPAGELPVGGGQIGLSEQGRCCIELAVKEARALGHHYIGTEHLLLGMLRDEESAASQVLREFAVTLDKAREVVKQALFANANPGETATSASETVND